MSTRDGIWPSKFRSGYTVTVVASTGSTNADLLQQAAAGAADGTVLVADYQTAGRGRRDRTWDAPPGVNLLASILFRGQLDPLHSLTQRVAVSAVRACEQLAGVTPSIKWPNDLLLAEAKLAGILAQSGGSGNRVDYVIVGIGLNIGWAPHGAARLPTGSRNGVLAALLDELAVRSTIDIFEEYRSLLGTLGRDITIEMADGVVSGRATDVERDGRLVVDTPSGRLLISAGDVIHTRPAAPSC
jgi:BirA family transcriptional regulator, biotin operon repressor / biotin---[acetyl-CoA-carboxylase] ligase